MINKTKTYKKNQSFENFYSAREDSCLAQKKRAITILKELTNCSEKSRNYYEVLLRVQNDLESEADSIFKITVFIADEMCLLEDSQLPDYLYHRYRYDIFPEKKELDDYPPYLQIEPASICNYRCVFCYQTDNIFSKKNSGFMGTMDFETYKNIVDQIVGKVHFLSLASRGEPLICKDLPEMLDYSLNKFLNLKINTNASMLTEKLCHTLLNGAVRTVVFSADAAEEPLYSKMRVNGNLERVLKNIERFQNIREKQYPRTKLITRVSGVLFDKEKQNMDSMQNLWGNLVDQVSFVSYNPWENIYDAKPNNIKSPCSDLWRRMFIWYDGTVNPCDSDYRSTLKIGSILDNPVNTLWHSSRYESLRATHIKKMRSGMNPCSKCVVT
ncbi:MAG: radical SAM protein [Nitrospina sp.]|nr:radical SAM protein [Nitrospina sp.]